MTPTPSAIDIARQTFVVLMPEIVLLVFATVMMTVAPFVRLPRRTWCATAAFALLAALLSMVAIGNERSDLYGSVALNDAFSIYGRYIVILTGFLVLALAHDQVDDGRAAEFFGSLLMINAGAMVVAAANELVFLFVGLELVSMPTYLLLYLSRRTTTTQEAATKYFFLSILSSGLLLFGLAYLYGLTGVSNLKALAYLAAHVSDVPQPQLALIAIVFITAGLGFRVAAVPFHFYAPDVYQGSPLVIAALLSWIPKLVGFLALLRTVAAVVSAAGGSGLLAHQAILLCWIIAIATMTLGNTVALAQDNLKRLLAYSSIAHAGYLMIGVAVACGNDALGHDLYFGAEGILFYLTAYALMTLGAFGVILLLDSPARSVETVDDLAGLGQTHPVAALAMTVCLFSLAGIPPLAGFYGKFQLFAAAFATGNDVEGGLLWWLALAGVLNSAIGAYYYLRIVVAMYLRPTVGPAPEVKHAWPTSLAVGICTVLTFLFGVYPVPISRASHRAAVASVALPNPTDRPTVVATVAPPAAARPAP